MQVHELMTSGINSISLDASLSTAARWIRDLDVGMLPVEEYGEVVGAVTDRDIVVRAIADGADPDTTTVRSAMSTLIIVCVEEDDIEHAANIMEQYRIRRLMVQNNLGEYVGMLSLADVARHRNMRHLSAQVLEEISRPDRPVLNE